MDLTLTPEQTNYLNKTSPIKADALKRAYKKSVEEQQETLNSASKILAKKK